MLVARLILDYATSFGFDDTFREGAGNGRGRRLSLASAFAYGHSPPEHSLRNRRTHCGDFYFEPEPEPEPELPPDVPEAPDEPPIAPDPPEELELPGEPLAPELWSPARRSQPTAVRLSAATTNKILDVVLSAFILVPFTKS